MAAALASSIVDMVSYRIKSTKKNLIANHEMLRSLDPIFLEMILIFQFLLGLTDLLFDLDNFPGVFSILFQGGGEPYNHLGPIR